MSDQPTNPIMMSISGSDTVTPQPEAVPSSTPAIIQLATPSPAPQGIPTPDPQGIPAAAPTPVPQGIPAAAPVPTPVPQGIPAAAPVPTPVPQGIPAAAPVPTPVPQGIPAAAPAPVPQATPTHVPQGMPTGAAPVPQAFQMAPSPQVVTTVPQVSPNAALPNVGSIKNGEIAEPVALVSYEVFNIDRLSLSEEGVQTKTIETKGEKGGANKITYYIIPLNYGYGPDGKRKDVLNLEGPEIQARGGIRMSEMNGKEVYSIMVRFDMTNPTHAKFINTLEAIYNKSASIIESVRTKLGSNYLQFAAQYAFMNYKNPIMYPKDDQQNPIKDTYATVFFKLMSKGTGAYAQKTLFTGLDKKNIDWSLLGLSCPVELKFVPVVQVPSIYVGAKPSLQMPLFSAIIIDVKRLNSDTIQMTTLQKYEEQREKYEANVNKLQNDIATLQIEKPKTVEAHQASHVPELPSTFPGSTQVMNPYAAPTPYAQKYN